MLETAGFLATSGDEQEDEDASSSSSSFSDGEEEEEDEDESSTPLTPEQLITGLAQINDAVQAMPLNLKQAYLEALRECPHLVETESDPIRLWKFAALDPWLAADHLCWYWRVRQLCLQDRWHLPLDFSGQGAFEPDDIEFLRHGSAAVLPAHPAGRPVLYVDRRRLIGKIDPTDPRFAQKWSRRSLFFQCHLTCLHPGSIRRGKMGILHHVSRPWALSTPHQKLIVALYQYHDHYVGACQLVYTTRRHYFLDQLLPQLAGMILSVIRPTVQILVLRSEDRTAAELIQLGYRKSGIPVSLGGEWSFRNYDRLFQALQTPGTQIKYTKNGVVALPPKTVSLPLGATTKKTLDEPELVISAAGADGDVMPASSHAPTTTLSEKDVLPSSVEEVNLLQHRRVPATRMEYKRGKRFRVASSR